MFRFKRFLDHVSYIPTALRTYHNFYIHCFLCMLLILTPFFSCHLALYIFSLPTIHLKLGLPSCFPVLHIILMQYFFSNVYCSNASCDKPHPFLTINSLIHFFFSYQASEKQKIQILLKNDLFMKLGEGLNLVETTNTISIVISVDSIVNSEF